MWQCSYKNRYGLTVTTEHDTKMSAQREAAYAATVWGYVPVTRNTAHMAEVVRMERRARRKRAA